MSNKETPEVCDMCKKTVAVVTTNKLYWCANCYTSFMLRTMNRPRVRQP
jgi:protein-arginine kinase activator protein McsA